MAGRSSGYRMEDGFRIVRDGPTSFSVEGFFRRGGEQRFRSASGFKSEAEARKWVHDQQARDAELDAGIEGNKAPSA